MSPSTLRRAFHVVAAAVLAMVVLAWILAARAEAGTKLLRYPDIHGEKVVFSYAGDLWMASDTGGTAVRLTAHPGLEYYPRFSPDGAWIAFTGQYDGDEQVYVVPALGGEPRQLTFFPARGPLSPRWGFDHMVYGWTPDGKSVLFRTLRDNWDIGDGRLYTVPLQGGLPTPLPMPTSGAGALSPDGRRIVYAPLFRDFRTWKRYQGGWATDLYIFDLERHEATRITDHVRSDRDPMWIGEEIYFASDRDGTLNLYRYEPEGEAPTQITFETVWDVRWPSSDEEGRIVYELDGELVVLDTATGASTHLEITVPTDGVYRRPHPVEAGEFIEDWNLAPGGERAVFVARGELFTVPAEHGPTRNLTWSSDAHERLATWSPRGDRIAYVSDVTGEEQIWVVEERGREPPVQLTDDHASRLYQPRWSPDGERLVYGDKEGRVFVLEVATRKRRQIADEAQGAVTDYQWSPHGGWIALSLSDPNGFRSIHLWSRSTGELHRVTDELFHQSSPAWDPQGRYLYFLGDREFAPQIGSFEWNYLVDRETGLFALALREDVPHPFPPRSDEVEPAAEEKEDETKENGTKGEDAAPLEIDLDGLADRVARVPVEADNHYGLAAVEGNLIYVRGGPFYYGRRGDITPTVKIFSLEDREEKDLAEGGGYALSADGKKILVAHQGAYKLYEVKPGGGEAKTLDTGGMVARSEPATEWETIFDEVWRRYRDFFYVENMHGYDWEAIGQRYRAQLADVAHRVDLTYVLGEMIAELNVSHAYVQGGDYDLPERVAVALPGARFGLDEATGRYFLRHIYPGQNEEERYRSPLTEVGVDVAEGAYVLAVNGRELRAPENPWRLLRGAADAPVTFAVASTAEGKDRRDVTFTPRTDDQPLRYLEWVLQRRRMVEEATGGRVGYLHVPDMGSQGIQEFIKWFYGQIRKEGLVIDVRGNGGGNVSQMLIERLRREVLRVRFVRTYERPLTYPNTVFMGHLVCLLNETSASDGDIFPAMFREAGLGPLIGKRSWGGVIGISGHGPLLDGGGVSVPQFGTNSKDDGSWLIEGWGVEPDIEVENTPKSILAGRDLQLERAVQEVLARIEEEPVGFPPRPADPVRTQ